MTRQERIVDALATPGCLFLVLTAPELRRQGMTYLSLYALLRVVEKADQRPGQRYSEQWLRRETGREYYETSRACTLLLKSDLVIASPDPDDRRVREFVPTARGRLVLQAILSAAGRRLWDGIQPQGRTRQVKEVTGHLRSANRILRSDFQLSIFDKDLNLKEATTRRTRGKGSARRGPVQQTR
ncbi:MAG TPA: MarR family winged helix-turn-helix transcriptional regulator [Terracidiphilus sp.]|nr:MarR family winged helix-turn-helix transcriptional regulator [Terracidiphilus sp.]